MNSSDSETDDRTCEFCQKTFSKPANRKTHQETHSKCSKLYYAKSDSSRKKQKTDNSLEKPRVKWKRDDTLARYVVDLTECEFLK